MAPKQQQLRAPASMRGSTLGNLSVGTVFAFLAFVAACGGSTSGPDADAGMSPSYVCDDSCPTANNGLCEDGQLGASSATCVEGSDCADCSLLWTPGMCAPGVVPNATVEAGTWVCTGIAVSITPSRLAVRWSRPGFFVEQPVLVADGVAMVAAPLFIDRGGTQSLVATGDVVDLDQNVVLGSVSLNLAAPISSRGVGVATRAWLAQERMVALEIVDAHARDEVLLAIDAVSNLVSAAASGTTVLGTSFLSGATLAVAPADVAIVDGYLDNLSETLPIRRTKACCSNEDTRAFGKAGAGLFLLGALVGSVAIAEVGMGVMLFNAGAVAAAHLIHGSVLLADRAFRAASSLAANARTLVRSFVGAWNPDPEDEATRTALRDVSDDENSPSCGGPCTGGTVCLTYVQALCRGPVCPGGGSSCVCLYGSTCADTRPCGMSIGARQYVDPDTGDLWSDCP